MLDRHTISALLMVLAAVGVSQLSAAASGEVDEVVADVDPSAAGFVERWVDAEIDGLLALYRHLHANPELSLQERATAARVAEELGRAGYRVTTGVGGTGVVGVLERGSGPTVLIRGDMDGLPVTEATGLEYASRVRATRADGSEVGVMHACGHDVHTANLIGTARLLADARDLWSGRLVIVAQPAEEIGRGALMMIEDGLFDRFPRPDYAIALHVDADVAAGSVGIAEGWAAANVDSIDITIHGRGGHGARPHQTVDPIVTAAHLVTALQTVVSRRLRAQEPAVVSVGSIHGGSKHNVIPDDVKLQLTVRSYSDEVRKQVIDDIRQIAEGTCTTFECPRAPEMSVKEDFTPSLYNDPGLARAARRIFGQVLGEEHVVDRQPSMGGEDFGRYSRALGAPGLQYRLGSAEASAIAAAEQGGPRVPPAHSSGFAPLPEPTLRTGLRTLAQLALGLLGAP